jgi:flagellar motility protein MotE (MotC chaperone)
MNAPHLPPLHKAALPAKAPAKKALQTKGPGALVILALLFASSGALRLGTDLGSAMAAVSDLPTADLPQTPASCEAPPAALAKALKLRDEELSARETLLDDRENALNLAQIAIEKRMGELAAAEEDLKKTISLADGAAEQDLGTLTAVYEAMKPADAAKLFATMAPEFAAGFLSRMQPASAAAILTGMTPEQAYSISVLIAGRNALAPKT